MDEAVASLLALNVVVTMMLLMSVLAEEETRAGVIRHAASEAAAVAASHLVPDAGVSQQREAESRAREAARRALLGICRRVDVEMVPSRRGNRWGSEQVAVVVTCERGADRERSAQGLAWVVSG